MSRRARFAWSLALLGAVGLPAWAGATLGTDELAPLLRQRPEQIAQVRAAYELSDSAFAQIRLGSHFPHLGGSPVGPYTVRLHRRAAQEPRERELLICTTARYLDRHGRELRKDAIFDAVRVQETITAILLRDVDAPGGCPA